jgi:TonB family protein
LTKESGKTGPARSLALGIDAYRLAIDPVTGVLETSGGVMRMAQSRPLFAAVLAGSLALHVLALFILNLLERAPPIRPDTAIEIPVELVSDPAAEKDKGAGKEAANEKKASAGQPGAEAKGEAKPKTEQAAKSEPPKQPPSAPAEKQAKSANPAKPAEAKPEPPKAVAAQPQPPKPAVAEPPKLPQPSAQSSEPPKPSSQPAQAPPPASGSTPANPMPTMAALELRAARPAPVSPFGVDDPWQAVAVPTPSAGGDQLLSYKTAVFGMLELAKQFPADARARGAHGTATVYFEIDDQGRVKTVKLLASSGDTELDVESLAVVERAAPFPKPPPGAQKAFAAEIEFDPAER